MRRPPVFSSPRPRSRCSPRPSSSPRRASGRADTSDARIFDLCAFVEVGILAIEHFGDDEAEHRVAEELERLVVDDAAGDVLVRARSMRQRVLEQAEIAEAVADARLERGRSLRRRPARRRASPASSRRLSTSRRAASATAAGTATAMSSPRGSTTTARSPRRCRARPSPRSRAPGAGRARSSLDGGARAEDDFRFDHRAPRSLPAAIDPPRRRPCRRWSPRSASCRRAGRRSATWASTSRTMRSRRPSEPQPAVLLDEHAQPLLAEQVALGVHRLAQAVGVEQEHVAVDERDGDFLEQLGEACSSAIELQPDDHAARRDQRAPAAAAPRVRCTSGVWPARA